MKTFRELDGLPRLRGKGADEVHPVEAVEVVEVHDVIAQIPRAAHEISDDPGVRRRLDPESVLAGKNAGLVMHHRAYAAKPLRKETPHPSDPGP